MDEFARFFGQELVTPTLEVPRLWYFDFSDRFSADHDFLTKFHAEH